MSGAAIQVRPRGINGPMYAPQRDLAYFYGPFMQEALAGLERSARPAYLNELMYELHITEEALSSAVGALAEALSRFVHDDEVRTVYDALTKSGFMDQPAGAQAVVLARLGEVLTAGFFVALRDVTPINGREPKECGLPEMLGSAQLLRQALGGKRRRRTKPDEAAAALAAKDAEILTLNNLVGHLQKRLTSQEKLTQQIMEKLQEAEARAPCTTAAPAIEECKPPESPPPSRWARIMAAVRCVFPRFRSE